jgi:2-dehydropantoate 2-reductase
MKVCVFGAGAVGSNIAAHLLRAGQAEVAVVARGAHLEAMRARGLTLKSANETFTVETPLATDDPASLEPQDLVLVTLKTVSLPGSAAAIGRLIAPGGAAVFLSNGIPWWWNYGRYAEPATLPLLDPDGALWREVRPERSLAGVIYSPNEIVEPGVVANRARSRFVLGAPRSGPHPSLDRAVSLFHAAAVEAQASDDIRREIWLKLLLNAPGNPLAALTRLTAGERAEDEGLASVSAAIIREVLAIAAAEGWDLAAQVDVDAIVRPSAALAGGRPSMLQDVLAGRPTEVGALLGQPVAIARTRGVATPVLDVVLPLMRGLDRAVRAGRT